MNYQAVDSSSIEKVAYDPETLTLGVCFHAGREYIYSPVSNEEYQRFRAAASLGRHFVEHIRNAGYDCQRIR